MRDVFPIVHALKGNFFCRRVRRAYGGGNVRPPADDAEHASAVRDNFSLPLGSPGVEYQCARILGVRDAVNLMSLFILPGVTARGEHNADRRTVLPRDRHVGEPPLAAGAHDLGEVPVEERQNDLRLGRTVR